jgi:hypothetical protein
MHVFCVASSAGHLLEQLIRFVHDALEVGTSTAELEPADPAVCCQCISFVAHEQVVAYAVVPYCMLRLTAAVMQEFSNAEAAMRPPGEAACMMCKVEPAEIKLAAALFEANTGGHTRHSTAGAAVQSMSAGCKQSCRQLQTDKLMSAGSLSTLPCRVYVQHSSVLNLRSLLTVN